MKGICQYSKMILFFVCILFDKTRSTTMIIDTVQNSSFEQENTTLFVVKNPEIAINQEETIFDNNYSEKISEISVNNTDDVRAGPHYEANWTFIDKETVRVTFFLFSLAIEKQIHHSKQQLYTTMISVPSRTSIKSLISLKYYLFSIRQYKTNIEKILSMDQLILRTSSTNNNNNNNNDDDHHHYYYSNALYLIRLNPKEKYSICIYYYQTNLSSNIADLSICVDILHDHKKPSVHGLFVILTQYSIILGILIVLQGLFSMRKRRLTHFIHQHIRNKTQRIRSTLSSVSLVRQSLSSTNILEIDRKKRMISLPTIVITTPSTSSLLSMNENEPLIKMATNQNHVHFFCNDNDDDDIVFIPSCTMIDPMH